MLEVAMLIQITFRCGSAIAQQENMAAIVNTSRRFYHRV